MTTRFTAYCPRRFSFPLLYGVTDNMFILPVGNIKKLQGKCKHKNLLSLHQKSILIPIAASTTANTRCSVLTGSACVSFAPSGAAQTLAILIITVAGQYT